MGWPDQAVEGFVLAASVAGDRGAEEGIGALTESPRGQALQLAERWAGLDRASRSREMKRVASNLRRSLGEDCDLPARARALVANTVARDVGARWLRDAPAPRRGFSPSPQLRETLRQAGAARQPKHPDGAAAQVGTDPDRRDARSVGEVERERGREVMDSHLRSLDRAARNLVLKGLGAAQAELLTGPVGQAHGAPEGDPSPGPLALLLRAARGAAPRAEVVRALGAMHMGLSGDVSGDETSTDWRRAGAEIAELLSTEALPWPE